MYCNRCGRELPDDSDFCTGCGAALAPAKKLTPSPIPAGSIGDEDTAFRAESAEVFKPGDVIADRYEVILVLGCGGMGAVYRVRDLDLGEECALKDKKISRKGQEVFVID